MSKLYSFEFANCFSDFKYCTKHSRAPISICTFCTKKSIYNLENSDLNRSLYACKAL